MWKKLIVGPFSSSSGPGAYAPDATQPTRLNVRESILIYRNLFGDKSEHKNKVFPSTPRRHRNGAQSEFQSSINLAIERE
jgi:hypothetical protein